MAGAITQLTVLSGLVQTFAGRLLDDSDFDVQSATFVLVGPTSGGAATPTFRALVAADVPAGGGSPLTTKGDLYGFDTAANRVPVGANGEVLTADSTVALGVKWAAPSGGGSLPAIGPNDWRIRSNGVAPSYQPLDIPTARAAVTSNINVSTPGATLDGLAMTSGDRVLLTAQTAPAQNGLWVWNTASSPMARPPDYPSGVVFDLT